MRTFAIVGGALGAWIMLAGLTASDAGPALPWWRRALERRGLSGGHTTRLAAGSLGSTTTGFVVTMAVGGLVPVAVVAGLAAGALPWIRLRSSDRRRAEMLREAWPDALASIIAGIRAGMPLPECCSALAERGPGPLRGGFGRLAVTYRASGSFTAGLQQLRDELQDPIGDRVALVLEMAHEVGGTDLVRVLRATSELVRDDLRTRGEVRARWSWTINAARVAGGAPVAVLIVMSLRAEARIAYGSPSGVAVIAVGSLVTFAAYRLMLRAARLPDERRLG